MDSIAEFDRMTGGVREALDEAQAEALAMHADRIGTSHILLGLAQGRGEQVAATVLGQLGFRVAAAREHAAAFRDGPDGCGRELDCGSPAPGSKLPFTARARQVLERSLREALQLGAAYVGTEHVLMALVERGKPCTAQGVLADAAISPAAVRRAVIEELRGGLPPEQWHPPEPDITPGERRIPEALARVSESLVTIGARLTAIERVTGREAPGGGPGTAG